MGIPMQRTLPYSRARNLIGRHEAAASPALFHPPRFLWMFNRCSRWKFSGSSAERGMFSDIGSPVTEVCEPRAIACQSNRLRFLSGRTGGSLG